MKIRAKMAGGFAGIERCVELDTACRPDGQALEALVRQADFFGPAPTSAVGSDLPRWEITVEDGERCHSVRLLDDGALNAAGWPALLAHLRTLG
ncbi:protealysin inhibitor emfourin [Massilia jejuensis]|uniref:Protealysin inhibitor emfourin n=1 Tax=Massilia jejuensis TaxID=648894 RepID=A0ABW0PB50_9BURK